MEENNFNIKTYKYPMKLNPLQEGRLNRWISLCKEVYNLMIEQRLAVKKYNDNQYDIFYPEKALEEIARKKTYEDKVKAEIASGKRLPKKQKAKIIIPIRL